MSRAKFDQSSCDSIFQCVKEIESGTDAEVVIVVRARSGSYRHADYLFGALFAFGIAVRSDNVMSFSASITSTLLVLRPMVPPALPRNVS